MSEFYGYYICFNATGVKEVDDVIEAVANACRGSHHTDGWRDRWHDESETSEDKIQNSANRAAEAFTALAEDNAKLRAKVAELSLNIEIYESMTDCFAEIRSRDAILIGNDIS